MHGRTLLAVLLGLACGCSDDGSDGSSSFGDPDTSAGTAPSTTGEIVDCSMVEIPGCDEVVQVCEGGQCGCECAHSPTTDGTTDPSSTSNDPDTNTTTGDSSAGSTSADSTSDTGDTGIATTDQGGGDGPQGECISVDVWESCAQYCAAGKMRCLPQGCDGATVHYFDTAGDCVEMLEPSPSSQACSDALETQGGVSFARCCCG